MNVVAFSGGKDSTCLALSMAERGEAATLLFTPTGRELPEVMVHVCRVQKLTGWPLEIRYSRVSFQQRIREYNTLPSHAMRWCTQQLKIEVAQAYLLSLPEKATLCVGLRADEEERQGMWGAYANYRYPLREWGWGLPEVIEYLDRRAICVPKRTDCDWCYDQRLYEWWLLWKEEPARWAEAEAFEDLTGHTFRSKTRDTWPAALKDLRARFEAGQVPPGVRSLPLFDEYETGTDSRRCRVCSM